MTHDDDPATTSTEVLARTDEQPAGSIVDTAVPTYVVAVADHRLVLSALGRSVPFDQPSTEMRIFDGRCRPGAGAPDRARSCASTVPAPRAGGS